MRFLTCVFAADRLSVPIGIFYVPIIIFLRTISTWLVKTNNDNILIKATKKKQKKLQSRILCITNSPEENEIKATNPS